MNKSYSELLTFRTFRDRYLYLQLLDGQVGGETFGHSRWRNQEFYRSNLWKDFRDWVIIRDNGCDLAFPGKEIHGKILVHHINPVTRESLMYSDEMLLDSENVISTSLMTHQAIHYGDVNGLTIDPIERSPNDMIPWRV